jgi:hypothetical protein
MEGGKAMAAHVVEEMLTRYDISAPESALKALREVLQEIILFGLHEGGFFESVAFYGGTALRVLHGLNRFSEDLDFSLRPSVESIELDAFGDAVENCLRRFEVEATFRRSSTQSPGGIAAAQIRTEPLRGILSLSPQSGLEDLAKGFPQNQTLRIKLEVDTGGARNFHEEIAYPLFPIPFPLRTMTLPCLFAGKMHALLCRQWGKRIKGRDWYDCLWFLRKKIAVNLSYLEAKLRQSGHWTSSHALQEDDVLRLYRERVSRLDVESAKKDLYPFLLDSSDLDHWDRALFESLEKRFLFEG